MRFQPAYTLWRRETLRYIRHWRGTILPPLITNILYIIVFGGVLGTRIDQIQGYDYIIYILPGLVMLSVIGNSFENASFSLFHSRWDHYINELLTSPISYISILFGYVLSSALRGVVSGVGVLIIALLFTPLQFSSPLIFLAFLLAAGVLFSTLGVVVGLWATQFSDLTTISTFLITPLVFLGGVFYSIHMLPGVWSTVSLFNPMTYLINGLRFGMINYSDIPLWICFSVVGAVTALALIAAVTMISRGYGLRE